ncbi:MAG: M20 aminoacylase family protein [Tabrizicola sp.]|uniref:M20 aminoacylase family protein n=1 Tax=Tabrizicola sp. TaxID=2005166 RepID=UPI0027376E4C|nr:M20 aminoacylase family protein [Tabrizicola sp.]MDP3263345.1 M20 aminoacylase family protein [Tabrizicola sp.]MDP3646702.1 M20 aminoacylase family protein [Paracoccaceae bacterium]MDZ4067528.1 M20 aminoacylase family protein [Tabrizicola sp.]
MPPKNRFAELLPEITAWRRDFHEHPELLFDVQRTAGKVAELLRSFGCDEVVEGIGRTGVVGVILGKTDTAGRVIGLRADMDALPIIEQTGVPYASRTHGKMHACGHDGHTAMLLGAAKYLAETRNFDGKVVLIFQPAEEGGGGGREMVQDGMITRWGIQEVYGMHNMPGIPVGHFAIRPGAMMAAADQFEITVTGKGGHAAKPHDCVDTTVVAAHVIVALQTIASRNVDPMKQVVVSVCTVQTDSTAHNVIPQVVKLKGTVRTMDAKVQDFVETRIAQIVEGTAMALGARGDVAYQRGYPVTVNAAENTAFAAEVAKAVSGHVDTDTPPLMGAEDFSFMLNERPGAYIFLGNGDTAMVHHPAYNFDDNAIPFGASWYSGMAEARMPAA